MATTVANPAPVELSDGGITTAFRRRYMCSSQLQCTQCYFKQTWMSNEVRPSSIRARRFHWVVGRGSGDLQHGCYSQMQRRLNINMPASLLFHLYTYIARNSLPINKAITRSPRCLSEHAVIGPQVFVERRPPPSAWPCHWPSYPGSTRDRSLLICRQESLDQTILLPLHRLGDSLLHARHKPALQSLASSLLLLG